MVDGIENVASMSDENSTNYEEFLVQLVAAHSVLYSGDSPHVRRYHVVSLILELPAQLPMLMENPKAAALAILARLFGIKSFVEGVW